MRIIPRTTNLSRYTSRKLAAASSINVDTTRSYFHNGHENVKSKLTTSHRFQGALGGLNQQNKNVSSLAKNIDLKQKGYLDDDGALQFKTLHELQERACLTFAENPLYGTYKDEADGGKNDFEWMTYEEFGEQVKLSRSVLSDLGVKQFSKVGIISNNRWEWAAIAAAAYSLNASLVPMYEAQLPADWTYIANDAQCDVLFCANQDIYDRAKEQVIPQTPSVKATICLDAELGEQYAFSTLMEAAATKDEASVILPTPDDLANLIYTSGTTGKPKGVELIHSNSVSNIDGVRRISGSIDEFVGESDVSLAFLPWAHSFGQTCELWLGMAHGSSSGICRGVPSILEDLQLVKPTILFAVPTLHKRIYDGVHNLMETASPIRKGLMKKALALGRKKSDEKKGLQSMSFMENIQFNALDKIVLSKIRDRFGGRLRHGYVGGAALPSEVINFLDDVGIPICEGYGLTETSPIITLNTPMDRSPGFVGKSLPDVHVVIMGENGEPVQAGEEGEICCYGPNVMRGYHNKPEATEEVMSLAPDGKSKLFHTGDLGRKTEDGWVKITGRLKEQYKLENGKYVCPTPIEEAIGMSRFIMQIVLCGANRPHNVALIVPDFVAIRAELDIDDSVSDDDMVNDDRVNALFATEIDKNGSSLKKFEIPQDFAFVAPFTAANNMLTPKMSIRRHMVIKEYQDVIASMYGEGVFAEACDGVEDKVA